MGDVLEKRRAPKPRDGGREGGGGRGGGEGALGRDKGEDRGVGAVDGPADGGGELRDTLARIGKDLGLTEVEDGIGGRIVDLGVMIIILRRLLGGSDGGLLLVVVLFVVIMGLLPLGAAVTLPLPPFGARICHGSKGIELGEGRSEDRNGNPSKKSRKDKKRKWRGEEEREST